MDTGFLFSSLPLYGRAENVAPQSDALDEVVREPIEFSFVVATAERTRQTDPCRIADAEARVSEFVGEEVVLVAPYPVEGGMEDPPPLRSRSLRTASRLTRSPHE